MLSYIQEVAMKKILLAAVIVSALSFLFGMTANAEEYKTVRIVVNDNFIDTEGIIKENRTLVPVRGVFEELEYDVKWVPESKSAFFSGKDYEIEMKNGAEGFLCVNNIDYSTKKVIPDVPQQIINGHFYIPLRAVSEAIGAEVSWDSSDYIASIYKELREKINPDDFGSDYIKEFLEDENIIYTDDLEDIYELNIPSGDFSSEVLADLTNFPSLYTVTFEGDPIEDYALLKEFFKKNNNDRISFCFPDEEDRVDSSNVDRFIDYYKIRKDIINRIINKSQSDFDKVLAIHDYMVLNTDYDYENYKRNRIPDKDYDPYYVLKDKKGVCEGYTRATMALLTMIGIENEYVSGKANGVSSWGDHAWLIVRINNNYYHMDVTFDDPVEMPSDFICWDYFLKADATMSHDHRWDKSEHNKCISDYAYTAPYDYFEKYGYSHYSDNYTENNNTTNNSSGTESTESTSENSRNPSESDDTVSDNTDNSSENSENADEVLEENTDEENTDNINTAETDEDV